MEKQIAYTDKQDNSPKIPYCTGLTELIEFEVATEPKEGKKDPLNCKTVLLDDRTNY
jgi:hypothetical protein